MLETKRAYLDRAAQAREEQFRMEEENFMKHQEQLRRNAEVHLVQQMAEPQSPDYDVSYYCIHTSAVKSDTTRPLFSNLSRNYISATKVASLHSQNGGKAGALLYYTASESFSGGIFDPFLDFFIFSKVTLIFVKYESSVKITCYRDLSCRSCHALVHVDKVLWLRKMC